jgi:hypothetical protein
LDEMMYILKPVSGFNKKGPLLQLPGGFRVPGDTKL